MFIRKENGPVHFGIIRYQRGDSVYVLDINDRRGLQSCYNPKPKNKGEYQQLQTSEMASLGRFTTRVFPSIITLIPEHDGSSESFIEVILKDSVSISRIFTGTANQRVHTYLVPEF